MATPRTSETHQKRVQKIAEDAASKIAAESPLEEEVVVVVEELPPGESAPTRRSRSTHAAPDGAESMVGMVAQGQKLVADSIGRWIDATSEPFGGAIASMDPFGGLFDPRRLTEESFRLAEEVLASQKQFALKLIEAMMPAKAA
jgi:hypothetical protein